MSKSKKAVVMVCALSYCFIIQVVFATSVYADVKRIKLIVIEDYGDFKEITVSELRTIPIQVMAWANIECLSEDANYGDATLKIQANGLPIKATYSDGTKAYTGAKISGDIIFSTNDSNKNFTYNGEAFPALSFKSDRESSPYDAPFDIALNNSIFFQSIVNCIPENNEVSRIEVFLLALDDIKFNKNAEKGLNKLGDQTIPYILDYLNSPLPEDYSVYGPKDSGRASAIKVLGKFQDQRSVATLVKVLDQGSGFARSAAAEVLAEIGYPGAIDPLVKAFGNGKNWTIAKALEKFPDPRVVEALLIAMERPKVSKFQKEKYSDALIKMTGQNYGQDTNAWRKWFHKNPLPKYSQ